MGRLHKLAKSASVRTSAIFYFGSLVSNISGYLFHLILIRLLAPAAYGEFLTYISFLYLLAIPSSTIGVFVTKYVADCYGKNDTVRINKFFYLVLQKIIVPFSAIGLLTILAAPLLSSLFKAHSIAFVVLGISVIVSLLASIIRSYALAFQYYVESTIVTIAEALTKIILAFILIRLGLAATGGVIALLATSLIGLLLYFYKIKPAILPRIEKTVNINIDLRKIFTYALIYSAGILSLMSVDVILVRLFFDPHTSGLYSGLSMLGRIIFYGTTPLVGMLLPFVTNRFAKKQTTKPVFLKLGLTTVFFGSVGLFAFTVKPALFITLISGNNYLENVLLLPKFSLYMFIFSVNYFILTYLMSVNRPQANWLLLLASISQALFIFCFHQSLLQIIDINLIIQICLLISLSLFYKIKTNNVR